MINRCSFPPFAGTKAAVAWGAIQINNGMERNTEQVASPCVNICQMNPETGYCIGCMRTIGEIADWLEMTNEEKRQVLNQLEERRKAAA